MILMLNSGWMKTTSNVLKLSKTQKILSGIKLLLLISTKAHPSINFTLR
ncbi:hypothetical protein RO3G_01768 [Rhizopus delemar RA 99-880]|uniref:Uncharacterized protein n=1 Tax=Rhizopus delemar (strain RA 99-880 / ATCC MYA-4621 / FGSC 9543 / NRRL 43880) TaxID=246409 RepID=I1BLI4_RHIO9|nr:hypothetical protein RO3G_01768 [Rhizopus delemar RA 99-880]|eukprot:EIE77064.1 hypothetical protein RO3G_01768 [Rhizopus delemar RA 99-880]